LYCKIIADNICFICPFSSCVYPLKRVIGSGELLERKRQFTPWKGTESTQAQKATTACERRQEKRTRGSSQGRGVPMCTCRTGEFAGSPREQTGTPQQFSGRIGQAVAVQKLSMVYPQKHFSSSEVHLYSKFPDFPHLPRFDSHHEAVLEHASWIPFR